MGSGSMWIARWPRGDVHLLGPCSSKIDALGMLDSTADPSNVVVLPFTGRMDLVLEPKLPIRWKDKDFVQVQDSTLKEDFRWLYNSRVCSDVDVIAEGVAMPAHMVVLASRSKYFRGMVGSGLEIRVDVSAPVMRRILEFIYTDEVADLTSDESAALLQASHAHGLPRLKNICERVLDRDYHKSWDFTNEIHTLKLAYDCSADQLLCIARWLVVCRLRSLCVPPIADPTKAQDEEARAQLYCITLSQVAEDAPALFNDVMSSAGGPAASNFRALLQRAERAQPPRLGARGQARRVAEDGGSPPVSPLARCPGCPGSKGWPMGPTFSSEGDMDVEEFEGLVVAVAAEGADTPPHRAHPAKGGGPAGTPGASTGGAGDERAERRQSAPALLQRARPSHRALVCAGAPFSAPPSLRPLRRRSALSVAEPAAGGMAGECPICQQRTMPAAELAKYPPLPAPHAVHTLICGHSFHRVCIARWGGEGKNSCPMCRHSFVEYMPAHSVAGVEGADGRFPPLVNALIPYARGPGGGGGGGDDRRRVFEAPVLDFALKGTSLLAGGETGESDLLRSLGTNLYPHLHRAIGRLTRRVAGAVEPGRHPESVWERADWGAEAAAGHGSGGVGGAGVEGGPCWSPWGAAAGPCPVPSPLGPPRARAPKDSALHAAVADAAAAARAAARSEATAVLHAAVAEELEADKVDATIQFSFHQTRGRSAGVVSDAQFQVMACLGLTSTEALEATVRRAYRAPESARSEELRRGLREAGGGAAGAAVEGMMAEMGLGAGEGALGVEGLRV